MEKRVNVLISTYNGCRYIREQIDSIKRQTYRNITIYVRDDGSADGTVDLLRDMAREGQIVFLEGENVGYGRSFFRLLEYAQDGDYWAFCDQDDVWLPEKIERSVRWLEERKDTPALYGCSFELTDETMQHVTGCCRPPAYKLDFRRAITDCVFQGFAVTLNRPLRELALRADRNRITSHDWWVMLLAVKFGEWYFDDSIGARHRRLDASVSGMSLRNRLKWLKVTLLHGHPGIRSCTEEYVRLFKETGPDQDLRMAMRFCTEKYRFSNAVYKACYPGRWRPNLSSEIIIRFLMLSGKV